MKVWSDQWPARITIVIEDGDFFRERSRVTGKMGHALLPTKNSAHRIIKSHKGHSTMKVSERQAYFRRSIALNLGGLKWGLDDYALKVEQECRLHRKVGGRDRPQPDSDACLTAIRDAIQFRKRTKWDPGFAGIIEDDCQIVDNCITSTISTASPRVCSLRIELVAMP